MAKKKTRPATHVAQSASAVGRRRLPNAMTPRPVFPLRLAVDERMLIEQAVMATNGQFRDPSHFIRAAAVGQAHAIMDKRSRGGK